MAAENDARLDVCGVCCPLPLIRLAKAVAGLDSGHELEVIGNDPIFEPSVRDFCDVNGHTVLDVRHEDGRRVRIRIRVGERP